MQLRRAGKRGEAGKPPSHPTSCIVPRGAADLTLSFGSRASDPIRGASQLHDPVSSGYGVGGYVGLIVGQGPASAGNRIFELKRGQRQPTTWQTVSSSLYSVIPAPMPFSLSSNRTTLDGVCLRRST